MTTTAVGRRANRVVIAVAIVVWTIVAWGGRIGLLTEGESAWAWIRVGGSAAVGVLAAFAVVAEIGERWRAGLLALFVVWTSVLWVRSLIVNWAGDGSLAFKLVHTVLAAGFFTLAWFAWTAVRSAESPL